MIGSVNFSGLSPESGKKRAPRFAASTWELQSMEEAATLSRSAVIKAVHHKKFADWIGKLFDSGPLAKVFSRDVRVGGMSLEDMSSRFITLFGLYLPQGYLAVKEKKHPNETNGRNALVWVLTFFLTQFLKNENFGVNSLLLNPFMVPKGQMLKFDPKTDIAKDAGPIKRTIHTYMKPPINAAHRFLNRHFGMSGDYMAVLKDAGIPLGASDIKQTRLGVKSPWASLDNNKLDMINNRYDELKKLVSEEGLEGLSRLKQPVSEALYHTYPKVIRRLNTFPLFNGSLVVAANTFVVGSLAIKLVYKFIAPLDKDFNPEAYKKRNKKDKDKAPVAAGTPAMPTPMMSMPVAVPRVGPLPSTFNVGASPSFSNASLQMRPQQLSLQAPVNGGVR